MMKELMENDGRPFPCWWSGKGIGSKQSNEIQYVVRIREDDMKKLKEESSFDHLMHRGLLWLI